MELSEEEVLQILKLIENSSFDFLQLEWGDLKLTVAKGGYDISVANHPAPRTLTEPAPSERPAPNAMEAEAKREPKELKTKAPAPEAAVLEAAVPINAPMVGTFYRAPEPGAPPFVEVGDAVQEETTVGLIEVMKVFTAVKAGVRGMILEGCVQNGQFVEYGQALFLIRPEEGSLGKGGSDGVSG